MIHKRGKGPKRVECVKETDGQRRGRMMGREGGDEGGKVRGDKRKRGVEGWRERREGTMGLCRFVSLSVIESSLQDYIQRKHHLDSRTCSELPLHSLLPSACILGKVNVLAQSSVCDHFNEYVCE